jgi:hypothetical protein
MMETTMSKSISLLFVLLVCSVTAFGQSSKGACILATATDGQSITLRGKTAQEPHDLVFDIEGCGDAVVLTYAGYPDNKVNADQLRQDESLKRFQKYTTATYKSGGENICMECMKYRDVAATLTGKLEIATVPAGTTKDQSGFLHDASGKIVGTSGFGHPTPMFKYRLVIFSASDVKATKQPKP